MVKDADSVMELEIPLFGNGETLDAITLLGGNPQFAFHLGGSHYFGCASDKSDFDFIAQESQALVEWLEKVGFTRMGGTEAEYDVPETQTRGVYQKGKVQVQVVFDLRATLAARDVLSKYFPEEHKEADREARRKVWSLLIGAVSELPFEFGTLAF